MKFNKLTIGFGAMALMFTSCDKAADQEYTPAAPVPTPAAYFSLDSDDEVIIDENQTEFSIPVYRANTTEASTVDVKCDVNGNYFTYVLIDADGNPQSVNPTVSGDNSSVTLPVTFAKGEGAAKIKVTYKWEDMAANAGKEYIFKLATEGEDSPYFKTTADVSAMFIPWENVVGPKGETTGKFIDLLIFSGFSLSGGNDPFEFEVTIQSNPISKGIFRVLTPYANMFTNSSSDSFQYVGGDVVNIMYINASDPNNVYLCDRVGKPQPLYDTYYVLSPEYGQITYWDRAAGAILNEDLDTGERVYPSAGGETATYETQEVDGVEYPNTIVFPDDHFYVSHGPVTVANGKELQILFPGGKEKKAWNDLGMGSYTEGILYWNTEGKTITYQVPVQQNINNPDMYRMVNPYTNWWPEEYPTDEDYYVQLDASDPNMVLVPLSKTGNVVKVGKKFYDFSVINAASFYLYYAQQELTPSQIVAQGLNDTMEDNVISLANLYGYAMGSDGNSVQSYIPSEMNSPGCKLVLPTGDAPAPSNFVEPGARNITKTNLHKRFDGGVLIAKRMFDINFNM